MCVCVCLSVCLSVCIVLYMYAGRLSVSVHMHHVNVPQYIPTTIVANGPLVWEIEQEINSVSSLLGLINTAHFHVTLSALHSISHLL